MLCVDKRTIAVAVAIICSITTTSFGSIPEDLLPGCREPQITSELVNQIRKEWPNWTIEKIREFWPDDLVAKDGNLENGEAHTFYGYDGRIIHRRCECCDSFIFQSAKEGQPQKLRVVDFRFSSRSLSEVIEAGKLIVGAWEFPEQEKILDDSEWKLSDDKTLEKTHQWNESDGGGLIVLLHIAIFRRNMPPYPQEGDVWTLAVIYEQQVIPMMK